MQVICEMVKQYGTRWSIIKTFMKLRGFHRSDNWIKNKWNTRLKKQKRQVLDKFELN